MNNLNDEISMRIFISLRKIIQAMDKHSSYLKKEFGITSSQLIILQKVFEVDAILVSQLAEQVSLSQATVTDVSNRLEKQGYLYKKNSSEDRRKKMLSLTDKGVRILSRIPPYLKKDFTIKFSALTDWEKMTILSAFERVASMMIDPATEIKTQRKSVVSG